MFIADIVNTAAGLEYKDFEKLYEKLSALRIQKGKFAVLNRDESLLVREINKGFPLKSWERLKYLDWKLEFEHLDATEEKEALKLAEAYEGYSVKRLSLLTQLAGIRKVSLDEIFKQLGLSSLQHG